jgi:hypothetical protein
VPAETFPRCSEQYGAQRRMRSRRNRPTVTEPRTAPCVWRDGFARGKAASFVLGHLRASPKRQEPPRSGAAPCPLERPAVAVDCDGIHCASFSPLIEKTLERGAGNASTLSRAALGSEITAGEGSAPWSTDVGDVVGSLEMV